MWGEKSTRENSQISYSKISYELSNYKILSVTVGFAVNTEWKQVLVEDLKLFSMYQKSLGSLQRKQIVGFYPSRCKLFWTGA